MPAPTTRRAADGQPGATPPSVGGLTTSSSPSQPLGDQVVATGGRNMVAGTASPGSSPAATPPSTLVRQEDLAWWESQSPGETIRLLPNTGWGGGGGLRRAWGGGGGGLPGVGVRNDNRVSRTTAVRPSTLTHTE